MADNVTLNSMSGGSVVAADDISSVFYQVVKLGLGADGALDTLVDSGQQTSANSIPVVLPSDAADVKITLDGETVTETNSGAIKTAVELIDNAISGTEMQVDVVAALPAGSNAIGKLAANSGVDIGDVDILSVVPGTGATNLGKIEDAAHTTGDVGVMGLAVRVDSAGALAGTDGDYSPLQVDSAGALRVTGGGGGTEYNEDAATPATITGTATVVERDDALSALTPVEGDWAALRCDANGALWTHDDALDAALSGSEIQVDVVAALPAGTNAIGKLAANSGVDIGDVDVTSVPAPLNVVGTGTEAAAMRVTIATDSTGVLSVDDNGGALTVDGTVTETNSGAIKTAVELIDNAIAGTEMQVDVVAALPAGTNAIGKLAANTGVDIGDVDVTSVPAPLNVVGGGTEAAAMRVTLANDSTGVVSVDDGGGTITVDGTITATPSGVQEIEGDEAEGSASLPQPILIGGDDGTDVKNINVDATTGDVQVDVTNTITETNSGDIKTAVELIDNAISGSEMQVDVVAALPAGSNAIGKLAANSGVDIGDVDVTSIVPGVGATNLGKAIDTATGATDTGVLALATRDDALGGLTPIEGDNVSLSTDANGALWTHDDALDAALSGSELQVDVVAALPAGTNAIGKLAANSGVDIGDVDVTSVPAPLNVVGTGTEAAAMRVTIATDSTGVLSVDDNGGALTVDGTVTETNSGAIKTAVELIDNAISGTEMQVDVVAALPAGSNAIGKLAANSGVDIGDVDVTSCANTSGDVAHDASDSGNPVKVGGEAYNLDGSVPGTAVAEGDRAHFITDVYGRQFVSTTHPNLWDVAENHSSAQTNNALKAAPGAGLSLYITDVIVSNGATAGNVKFVEDTAGTPVDVIEVMYFAVNGGAVINFKTPLKITANKDFGFTSVSSTTHSITVCGFTAP